MPSLRVVGCVAACLSGIARPLGGWVCYRLVSELLVETPRWYGTGSVGQSLIVEIKL
jgi:hypothetical protein